MTDPLARAVELAQVLALLDTKDDITEAEAMAACRVAYAKGHEDGARERAMRDDA